MDQLLTRSRLLLLIMFVALLTLTAASPAMPVQAGCGGSPDCPTPTPTPTAGKPADRVTLLGSASFEVGPQEGQISLEYDLTSGGDIVVTTTADGATLGSGWSLLLPGKTGAGGGGGQTDYYRQTSAGGVTIELYPGLPAGARFSLLLFPRLNQVAKNAHLTVRTYLVQPLELAFDDKLSATLTENMPFAVYTVAPPPAGELLVATVGPPNGTHPTHVLARPDSTGLVEPGIVNPDPGRYFASFRPVLAGTGYRLFIGPTDSGATGPYRIALAHQSSVPLDDSAASVTVQLTRAQGVAIFRVETKTASTFTVEIRASAAVKVEFFQESGSLNLQRTASGNVQKLAYAWYSPGAGYLLIYPSATAGSQNTDVEVSRIESSG